MDESNEPVAATVSAATGSCSGPPQHFKMYKPAGVLSQFVFNHRKRRNRKLLGDVVKVSCISLPQGIMAIGRLDEDTEGLLLLTTDGKMSKRVREKDTEKEYWVQVNGTITEDSMNKLRYGVEIALPVAESGDKKQNITDGRTKKTYRTLPCKVSLLDTTLVQVTTVDYSTQKNQTNSDAAKTKRFKGTCNKCGVAGHKNNDCPLHLSDKPPNKVKKGSKTIDGESVMTMLLPPGISPSNRISLAEESLHSRTSWISITITEGKNRQVRRMTAAVGHPTLRLVRVRIGSVVLGDMVEGEVRSLDQSEIQSFVS
jgi:pseudouridine synthase